MNVATMVLTLGMLGLTPPAERPTLRLVWFDAHRSAALIRNLVFAELSRLLGEAGMALQATVWDGSEREPKPDEIEVSVQATPPPPLPPDTLGATRPEARQIGVFVGSIREALHLDPRPQMLLLPRDSLALSRAVARVIVHELAHDGAPAEPHARDGLMAPRVGRGLLTEPCLHLAAAVAQALRFASRVG